MELGEKIRLLRLSKGLSQENVADELRISTSAYGDIERNKTELTVSRLVKIAKILNVDIDDIIAKNCKPEANTKEKLELDHLKAELLLWQIESHRWKERFMRSVFSEKTPRQKIGFK
jgi:XRE family transcriptional regulator, regulator of sulfur utilization